MNQVVKGYKAFNKDLTCRGFQYEIGKVYEIEGELQICKNGFHFCKTVADCYLYYPQDYETRICEIEALGEVIKDEKKFCTNKIKIMREVIDPRKLRCNTGESNSGFYNTGDYNTGNHNDGCFNTGFYNSGQHNTGWYNSGKYNSGSSNTGFDNTGSFNSGSHNSGQHNAGCCNSGDWNSGNHSSGVFNTKYTTIKIFDKESEWTYEDWVHSAACAIMDRCPETSHYWVDTSEMTLQERREHPEYKIIGGYLKINVVTEKDKQDWWDSLPEGYRNTVMMLPNFDADKFYKCTGIRVKEESRIRE